MLQRYTRGGSWHHRHRTAQRDHSNPAVVRTVHLQLHCSRTRACAGPSRRTNMCPPNCMHMPISDFRHRPVVCPESLSKTAKHIASRRPPGAARKRPTSLDIYIPAKQSPPPRRPRSTLAKLHPFSAANVHKHRDALPRANPRPGNARAVVHVSIRRQVGPEARRMHSALLTNRSRARTHLNLLYFTGPADCSRIAHHKRIHPWPVAQRGRTRCAINCNCAMVREYEQ